MPGLKDVSLFVHETWRHIQQVWRINFSDDPNFTYDFLAQLFAKAEVGKEKGLSKYDRHLGDQYQNHGQNHRFDTAIEVVEQYKQFSGTAAEEFAQAFKAQTGKIVEALKVKEERRNYHHSFQLYFKNPGCATFLAKAR